MYGVKKMPFLFITRSGIYYSHVKSLNTFSAYSNMLIRLYLFTVLYGGDVYNIQRTISVEYVILLLYLFKIESIIYLLYILCLIL